MIGQNGWRKGKCQPNRTSPPSFSSSPLLPNCFKPCHFFSIFLLILLISPAKSLTSEERGELARKFKYYHRSVRPSEQFNMVETVNGTFFRLLTQLELLDTRELETRAQLSLEMSLFVHFRDDRLQLRDLQDMPIPIPEEFQPWQPRVQLFPLGTTRSVQMQRSTNLGPKNGLLTVVHRFSGQILCDFDHWKVPFESYECQFWFETDPDERLHLTVVRDLRPSGQMHRIGFDYEQWPWLLLRFHFASGQWHSALVGAFLPSLLLLCCALLAQWKRRKIQVLVSLGAILAVILIQFGQGQQQPSIAPGALNLLDLWLAAVFVHLVCLLSADLLLPARRVLVFKRAVQEYRWIGGDGRHQGLGGYAYSPLMGRGKSEGKRQNGSSPSERSPARPIRATLYPSSGSLQHHYVSSPQLGHGRQPVPRQRTIARLPAAPSSPAQMIRTFSVPPRRLDDVRRELVDPSSSSSTPVPPPMMGGSAPLSRKRTVPGEGLDSDERERAIASLLSEMESIRRAESAALGPSSAFRRGISSEEEEFGTSGPAELMALRMGQAPPPAPPPGPVPTGRFQASRPPPPPPVRVQAQSYYGESGKPGSDDELGRLQGPGIPRRKQVVLYVILTSFCLFSLAYSLLVTAALLNWL